MRAQRLSPTSRPKCERPSDGHARCGRLWAKRTRTSIGIFAPFAEEDTVQSRLRTREPDDIKYRTEPELDQGAKNLDSRIQSSTCELAQCKIAAIPV
jgi:hypothetical protein